MLLRLEVLKFNALQRFRLGFLWLFIVFLFFLGAAKAGFAERGFDQNIRVATYSASLSRKGPGLLLRDVMRLSEAEREDTKHDTAEILAIQDVINHVNPDVLLLTDVDFDQDLLALNMFNQQLSQPYPYLFSVKTHAGQPSGFDLDEDGRFGESEDALGYGRFLGDGGMALLSRFPVEHEAAFTLDHVLLKDVPDVTLPDHSNGDAVYKVLPMSSKGHWAVPLMLPSKEGEIQRIYVVAFAASTPVFDGPEDRNGLRNAAEISSVVHLLGGAYQAIPDPVIVMGNANVDPYDGEGHREALGALLRHERLQKTDPWSLGAAQDEGRYIDIVHQGAAKFDTVQWAGRFEEDIGNLRVSYILPDRLFQVLDARVFWPAREDALRSLIGGDGLKAGAHKMVYVDMTF